MRGIPFEQRLHAPLNVALPLTAIQIRGIAYLGVEERFVSPCPSIWWAWHFPAHFVKASL